MRQNNDWGIEGFKIKREGSVDVGFLGIDNDGTRHDLGRPCEREGTNHSCVTSSDFGDCFRGYNSFFSIQGNPSYTSLVTG